MSTYTLVLACKHTIIFSIAPPKIGEQIYCFKCEKLQRVTAAPPEYRIRCRGCRYGRSFGRGQITAETAAAKHSTKRRHIIDIFDGYKHLATMGIRPVETLTFGDDDPPF
jgi:hypothetical protein